MDKRGDRGERMDDRDRFEVFTCWEATDGDGPGARSSSTGEEFSPDDAFEILRNARRRTVLRQLLSRREECHELSALAEQLAAEELGKSVRELTAAERKNAYVALYQTHLPKMDAAGVAAFDPDRKTVELDEHGPRLAKYLMIEDTEAADGAERTWGKYHPLVSVGDALLFGACLYAAVAAGFEPTIVGMGLLAFVAARTAVQLRLPRAALA